jgi:hypothetical protein
VSEGTKGGGKEEEEERRAASDGAAVVGARARSSLSLEEQDEK